MVFFPDVVVRSLKGFSWFARVTDKARAVRAGTEHDYIYPCPMDLGVFERWGLSVAEFDRAIAEYESDDDLIAWLKGRVDETGRERGELLDSPRQAEQS